MECHLELCDALMDSDAQGFVQRASVFNAFRRPAKNWSETGLFPSQVVLMVAPFASTSVRLLIEKFSPMGSYFDKDREEAAFHSGLKKPDDAAQYVPVWRVEEERVFALVNPIGGHCHQAFSVGEGGDGIVVGQRVL